MLMEDRVDVVFLDISMPGASGCSLPRRCISQESAGDCVCDRV
ncbi:MAG: hypothetical protein ACLU0O_07305 [Collinsella sp.]